LDNELKERFQELWPVALLIMAGAVALLWIGCAGWAAFRLMLG
jgi:hypothetical protein